MRQALSLELVLALMFLAAGCTGIIASDRVDAGLSDGDGEHDAGITDADGERDAGLSDGDGEYDAGAPEDLVEIAVGDVHTCARFNNGTIKCWGDNYSGELGYPTTAICPVPARNGETVPCGMTPTEVGGLSSAAGIVLQANRSYAWLEDGTVWRWGNDELNSSASVSPVLVTGLSGVVEIAAGSAHVCARLGDGTVACWGANNNGQLGDGTTTDHISPVLVPGLSGVAQIAAGGSHTCARFADDTVTCWGANPAGQLGVTTDTLCEGPNFWPCSTTPSAVPGLTGVEELSLGAYHSCARLADLTILCWGDNSRGELGSTTTETCSWGGGSPACSTTPIAVPGLTDVAQVAAGMFYTCARLGNGTVLCWGNNAEGQLGYRYQSVLLRVDMDDATTTVVGGPMAGLCISLGWNDDESLNGLVVSGSGSWDSPYKAGLIAIQPDTAAVTPIFETPYHTIMGLAKEPGSNAFYTWVNSTSHNYGEIDLDNEVVNILGSSDAVGVSSGAMTYKATAPWGPGVLGVTWGDSALVSFDPISGQVTGNLAQLSAGESFVGLAYNSERNLLYAVSQVALNLYSIDPETGQVLLIGRLDTDGQDVGGLAYDPTRDALYTTALYMSSGPSCGSSGDPCSTTPIAVPKLADAAQVEVFFRHSCARLTDGDVMCWGLNNAGQLGDGTTVDRITPAPVEW